MQELWKEIENKFNIKFMKEDGGFRPVNEWLDDIYLTFSPQQLKEMLQMIMNNGDFLFEDILSHQE